MKKSQIIIFSVTFLISVAIGFFMFRSRHLVTVSGVEVDWRLLGELDYITGQAPPQLKNLDNQSVKIPGFMVPLEDNQKKVIEFLLVPTPQACIHVPPPPPNQMVLVTMEEGREVDMAFGPVWVIGHLQLKSKRHFYGESSFFLKGWSIEPYQ